MGVDDGSNPLAPEFANPLPPPSKPKGAGGSAPAATPMTNSDFRKLLSTPRAAGGAQVAPKGGRRCGGGDFQKPKPRKPAPRPKPVEVPPEEPAYRDRAKERREESAPEYQGELSGAVLAGVAGGVPGVTARDELRQLSVEESKFLGGDVEHTHLVKGLDFALLRKVRAEMAETEKDVAFERGREARASADVRGETRVPGRVPDPLDASSSQGAFGRAVADAALAASALDNVSLAEIRPNERFASGRVSFAFDLSRASASDVPATTMRSASDPESRRADAGSNRVLAGKDAPVLERLGSALTRVRAAREATGGDDKKARRRAERAAAAAAAAARAAELAEADRPRVVDAEDDEDIFGDAGRDYVPTISARGSGADAKAASYFGDGAAKGEASISPRATRAKEEDVRGDGGADARGLDGPMPEPPAPDFNSIEPFKAHYRAYVAAGTVGGAWDSVAAGDYLREHPEFALALTAHSVRVQREEEEREAEAEAAKAKAKTPAAEKRPGARGPMDAAAARAELERRAEESLAADDGYGECYAGGAYGGAAFYASDEEEEEGKKKKGADEDEDGNKGKKSGLGAGVKDKDGKVSARALEAQRDQKINSELGSLHKVMREKYGDKVDVAFGEPREGRGAKRGGETGGEGVGAAGDDEGGGGRRGKRLKI